MMPFHQVFAVMKTKCLGNKFGWEFFASSPRGIVQLRALLLSIVVVLPLAATSWGADPSSARPTPDFTTLSLEELANYPVTSVAGHAEELSKSPAAIYVITQEDLRRSGASSIPEALRLAP